MTGFESRLMPANPKTEKSGEVKNFGGLRFA
jgi:hypothetical protein